MKIGYVYILASGKNGTLYIGVTSDLAKRVWEHKNHVMGKKSFSAKYDVTKLVYYEECGDMYDALNREKRLKRYERKWKIELIEKDNPGWRDLYDDIAQ
jgi:putative endonuclease